MKLIQLLNRLADQAFIPKKISFWGRIWEYNEQIQDYTCYWADQNLSDFISFDQLNDEVKIINQGDCRQGNAYQLEDNETIERINGQWYVVKDKMPITLDYVPMESYIPIKTLGDYCFDKDGKYTLAPSVWERVLRDKLNEVIEMVNKMGDKM